MQPRSLQSTFISPQRPKICCPPIPFSHWFEVVEVSSSRRKRRKMTSALSSPSTFSTPLQSGRTKLPSHSTSRAFTSVKASGAGDGRESAPQKELHHRRGHHQQQKPPRSWLSQSAPVGLWEQFPTARTVQQMMETMERMMEDPFAYSGISFPSLSGNSNSDEYDRVSSYRRWRTPWEIKEGEREYRMRFDMPGMTKEDVKVWVEEKILVVKAQKIPKKGDEGGNGAAAVEEGEGDWSAKSYGRYNSRIVLPDDVEVGRIKAEVKDGVLYIAIPKASVSAKVLDIDVK